MGHGARRRGRGPSCACRRSAVSVPARPRSARGGDVELATEERAEAAGALDAGVGVRQQQQGKKEAGACGMGMERELGQVFEEGDSEGEKRE